MSLRPMIRAPSRVAISSISPLAESHSFLGVSTSRRADPMEDQRKPHILQDRTAVVTGATVDAGTNWPYRPRALAEITSAEIQAAG